MFHLGCFGCGEPFGCVGAMVVDEECVLEMDWLRWAESADKSYQSLWVEDLTAKIGR